MISTLLALIVRIVTNPLANVFQKKLTENNISSLLVNLFTYLLLSLGCCIFSFNINWTEFSATLWLWAAMSGVFGAIGNGCLIKALQNGELSLLGPINSYKSIVAMVIGIFFLNEIPDLKGIIGIIFVIYGSYFIFETQKEGFSFALFKRKDIQFRILATVMTAIEAVFIKKIVILSSAFVAFILWCWFGFLFSCLLVLGFGYRKIAVRRNNVFFSFNNVRYFIGIVICVGLMQLSTNYVFKQINVSYALALFQLSLILSVILGFIFFNERQILKKLVGSFFMMFGSILIILG